MLFAQLFNADAVECGLCNTIFSPVRFESFLAQISGSSDSADHSLFNVPAPVGGTSDELS